MKKAKQENYERGSGSTSRSTVLFFGYNNMPNKGIKNCKGYKELKKYIRKFKLRLEEKHFINFVSNINTSVLKQTKGKEAGKKTV